MAHSIASVGGGFVWPNVLFASDGESIAIASRPSYVASAIEPVRYLRETIGRVSAENFEQSIDTFLEIALSRMDSLKIDDRNLSELWHEVLEERRDPVKAQYRKLEAICGYDPDEAPFEMIQSLLNTKNKFGSSAMEEVAAAGRHATLDTLLQIENLAKPAVNPIEGSVRGKLPLLDYLPSPQSGERPWQIARKFAKFARHTWGLSDKPVTHEFLAELMCFEPNIFEDRSKSPVPMHLALKSGDDEYSNIYFCSSWNTSKRFAIARLIGDNLLNHGGGDLLPATKVKTARQQFQRAFAQEFLCPFDALQDKINSNQTDENEIESAADHFEISPWVVQTTLINKGELDRDAFALTAPMN